MATGNTTPTTTPATAGWRRYLWPWGAIGAAAVLLPVTCCGVGIGVGMMLPWRGAGPSVSLAKPAESLTKPADKWNWQDLQDYLAKKGMKTSRGQVTVMERMWFVPGDGSPIDREAIILLQGRGPAAGNFFVMDLGTPEAAQREVSEKYAKMPAEQAAKQAAYDAAQGFNEFAWSKFVCTGTPATLAELKKLLP
jgi:hypothetical protein